MEEGKRRQSALKCTLCNNGRQDGARLSARAQTAAINEQSNNGAMVKVGKRNEEGEESVSAGE